MKAADISDGELISTVIKSNSIAAAAEKRRLIDRNDSDLSETDYLQKYKVICPEFDEPEGHKYILARYQFFKNRDPLKQKDLWLQACAAYNKTRYYLNSLQQQLFV